MSFPRYSEIPVTKAIAQLPTTRSGMIVPYTTLYVTGSDDPSTLERQPGGGFIRQCSCEFGTGRPRLGRPCVHRQRKAVRNRRCVICGRGIQQRALCHFVGATTANDGLPGLARGTVTSIEAPAHAACAAYSALTCPHLMTSPHSVPVATASTYEFHRALVIGFEGMARKVHLVAPGEPVTSGAIDENVVILRPGTFTTATLPDWMARYAPHPYSGIYARALKNAG